MKTTAVYGVTGLLLAATMLCSCNDYTKDPTDVALFIKPYASDTLKLKAGENALYEIEFHTVHNYISRLQVVSFDAVQNTRTVKDTAFSAAQEKFELIYTAPYLNKDTTLVKLTFKGWDDAGSSEQTNRYLFVIGQQILLQEQTGIVLWSPESGRPNAFAFASPSQPFCYTPHTSADEEENADDETADIYMVTNSDFTLVSVKSSTNAKFVRNNSFDYATATANSIQAVYESSRREDGVNNLKVNDIILVGHGSTAEGVMAVTNIVRDGSDEERSIRLSFKGVVAQ